MRAWLVVVLAGCGFTHGQLGTSDSQQSGEAGDDGPSSMPDVPAAQLCDASDTHLRLCLEFDDVGIGSAATAVDGSSGHHNATLSSVSVATRNAPATSQALAFTDQSGVRVPDNASLDVQRFTITAWVKRDGLPGGGGIYGLFDSDYQYTMMINDTGQVDCYVAIGGSTYSTNVAVMTGDGEWDFVACSYDGTNHCAMSLRPNGTRTRLCNGRTGAVDPGTTNGAAIGAWIAGASGYSNHLTGALDSVRVYDRAMSLSEVCSVAGLTGC